MLTNYIVTLLAMFAVIFSLFNAEIKENFSLIKTDNGLAPNGGFFGFGGNGVQLMPVGVNPQSRMYEGKNYNLNYERKLGYDTREAFPVGEPCYKTGVDAGRNMQTAPPPRFMVT